MTTNALRAAKGNVWEKGGGTREYLRDPRGVVVAEIYQLRISGDWVCNRDRHLSIWKTQELARKKAEG